MGQGGPWSSPGPHRALLVTEGLGGHPWVGEAGGLALRCTLTGVWSCWPSTQLLP